MTYSAQGLTAVAMEAVTMPPGMSHMTTCPKCNGGVSRERKLSITRTEEGAKYHCFRASCSFAGFIPLGLGSYDSGPYRPAPVAKPARPYAGETRFDAERAYSLVRYYEGFSAFATTSDVCRWGVLWEPSGSRVFECRDVRGKLTGHAVRDSSKAIKQYRLDSGRDIYAVYDPPASMLPAISLGRVVVEDAISAMACASHGYTGIALLGVNVPPDLEEYLHGLPFLVMLDPDAELTALRVSTRFRYAKAALGMRADPKDTPDLGSVLRSYL